MSGLNQAFSEMAAFTFRNQEGGITSSILGLNAFLEAVTGKDGKNIKKSVSGGEFISRAVTLLENPTMTNFDGYGEFSIDSSESSTIVTVPWRNKATVVTASGPEIRMNSGKAKLKDLVQTRTEVARDTQANHMAVEVMGDASNTSTLNGLAYWLRDDGQGNPGGVDSAVYTNWRNQVLEMPGTNTWGPTTIRSEMNKLYAACQFSGTKPDMWLVTNDIFHAYQDSVQQQIRYTDSKDAEGAKDVLYHLGAKVVRDVNANFGATAERGYCLTTKHWEMFVHPDADWTDAGERMPANADAVVRPMIWMGNIICKSRRTQGVLKDAA